LQLRNGERQVKRSSPLPVHPPRLARYLAASHTPTWRQFRDEERDAYEELCTDLHHRQRGLCAFCENGLVTSLDTHAREIEHWRPKSLDVPPSTRWTFGIGNLQLGCLGGSKKYPAGDVDLTDDPEPGPNRSCGAQKGNEDPALGIAGVVPYRPEDMPESPAMFWVGDDGSLRPADDCAAHGLDPVRMWITIDYLGLNCTRLKNARRTIVQALDHALLEYVDAAAGSTDDERFDAAYHDLARDTAPSKTETLPRFVTTLRSFFGRGLDEVLFPEPGWSIAT
jgi:uncharacterized protein (TIGR02646 family)